MRKNLILLSVTFLIGLGVGILLWQQIVTARLIAENQRLQAEAQAAASLAEENSRLQAEHIDPAELKRLRDGQAEVLRLRGQTAQLRREANDAKAAAAQAAKLAEQQAKAATALAQPTNDLPFETFTANISPKVMWKQMVVTGGWKTSSGKRVFLLLQPFPSDNGAVSVRSRFIEVPEQLAGQMGLDLGQGVQSFNGIFSEEQSETLLTTMKKTEGVTMLMAPEVSCLSGQSAQVQNIEAHSAPNGQTYFTGPVIDLVPTISADRQTVELAIDAKINLPRSQNP